MSFGQSILQDSKNWPGYRVEFTPNGQPRQGPHKSRRDFEYKVTRSSTSAGLPALTGAEPTDAGRPPGHAAELSQATRSRRDPGGPLFFVTWPAQAQTAPGQTAAIHPERRTPLVSGP
jgi:hypothetical protein